MGYNRLMDIESILLGFSYVGIFALMIVNGIVPFISSQILYIFVGYFVGTGFLQLFPASLIGASGNTVGNVILYEAVRAKGLVVIEKLKMFKKSDIQKVEFPRCETRAQPKTLNFQPARGIHR